MFSSSMDRIPRIASLAHAERAFDRITPVRGRDAHARPLRKRKEQHKLLVKLLGGAYAARLYQTDMVTWHTDGTVSLTRDDHQMSTEFVNAVAPHGLTALMHKGRMWMRILTPGAAAPRFFQPKHREALHFQPGAGSINSWQLLNMEDCVRHETPRVNRAKSKVVREAMQPVLHWISAVKAIGSDNLGQLVGSTGNLSTQQVRHAYEDALDGSLDPEHYPKFLTTVSRVRGHWDGTGITRQLIVSPTWKDQIIQEAYRVADVFDRVEVPLGELPPDSKWNKFV